MRDRLVDLSREYQLDDIVRLEKLAFRHPNPDEPVALRTGKWAIGVVSTDAELDAYVRRIIRQLDIRTGDGPSDEFVVGASWDGCGDDDEDERQSRTFDDVEEMAEFYSRMEREGRNPSHSNTHGPAAWQVTYDRADED